MKKISPKWLILFLLTGCEDKAIVNIYDKTILNTPVTCMSLNVVPANETITQKMKTLYRFDPKCSLHLNISYKNSIVCNSTYNVQTKSIQGFPTSYLNMEVRQGLSLKYSYYIDLTSEVSGEDLQKGFERIKRDLNIQ